MSTELRSRDIVKQQRVRQPLAKLLIFACVFTFLVCSGLIIYQAVSNHPTSANNCTVPSPQLLPGSCKAAPPSNITVALVLIDERQHSQISPAIISVLTNTPIDWPLYLLFPKSIHEWLKAQPWHAFARAQNRSYKIQPSKPATCRNQGQQSANCFLTAHEFWNTFSEDYILLFQQDSALCSKEDKSIANFLQYDYVGAPWPRGVSYDGTTLSVGNGGFSLRNRSFMQQCIRRANEEKLDLMDTPEDVFFSSCA